MRDMIKPLGFTLIELMIVVAIVAILAAIAYPSYQDSVRKSRRADAKAVLLEAAQWMERFYTENHCYHRNTPPCSDPTATVMLPAGLRESPKEGGAKYYDITLPAAALTQNSFELRAIPKGVQSSDPCKTLTLRNNGVRGVTGDASLTADECWR